MISIVTVNYNSGDLIQNTFESVFSQTGNYEYIVIDGDSSDISRRHIEVYKKHIDVLHISKDNGIYDAMNKALRMCSREWILFLNSGDTLVNADVISRLEAVISESFQKRLVGAYFGDTLYVQQNRTLKLRARTVNKFNLLLYGTSVVCHQSVLYRVEALRRYDEVYSLKSELDSYFSILSRGYEFSHIDILISSYLDGGLSTEKSLLNSLEALKINFTYFGILSFLGFPVIIYRHMLNIFNRKHRKFLSI